VSLHLKERITALGDYHASRNAESPASFQDRLPFAHEPPAAAETPHHDNIRGATYYAAKETPNAE